MASAGSVALTWTAPSVGSKPLTYTVRRSTTSGSGYTDIMSGVAATSYADGSVTNGTTYYYVVAAKNAVGTSDNSNEASATPDCVPALAFDFATGSLVPTAGSQALTFARTETGFVAMHWGPDGLLRFAPHNLALNSQDLGAASWTLQAVTVATNVVLAPDGTMTADEIVENATTGGKAISTTVPKAGVSQHYTCSAYFKTAGRTWAGISLESAASGVIAYFDIVNGGVGSNHTNGAGMQFIADAVTNVGNGWFRAQLTALSDTSASIACRLWSQDVDPNSGTPSDVGDVTKGIDVWGVQLEHNFSAGLYMPTTSTAQYGGPRFEYNPASGIARGLLIEESRTNLFLHSDDMTVAPWTISGGTANMAPPNIAPDGTDTPIYVVASPATANVVLGQSITKPAVSQTYTCSVYVRYAGACFVALSLDSGTGRSIVYHYVCGGDGADGAGLSCPAGNTYVSNTRDYVGNLNGFRGYGYDWRRISITGTTDASTTVSCSIWTDNDFSNACTPTPGPTPGGGNDAVLWGPQLELGDHPTSYIPTTTAPVTRQADNLSIAGTASWFNPAASTWRIEADTTNQAGNEYLVGGANLPEIALSTTAINPYVDPSLTLNPIAYSVSDQLMFRVMSAFASGNSATTINGNPAATDTQSFSVNGAGPVTFGANGTTRLNGHLRRLAYYDQRVADADLERLSVDRGFVDDFNDGVRSSRWATSVWSVDCSWCYDTTSAVGVAETGGVLVFSYANNDGTNGYITTESYDFTGASMSVELVTPPPSAIDVVAAMDILLPGGSQTFELSVELGNLLGEIKTDSAGWISIFSIAYDPIAHRYLRLRHDTSSDNVFYETSPDGAAWTVQGTTPTFAPIVEVFLMLSGSGGTGAPAGTPDVVLDNFATNAARN